MVGATTSLRNVSTAFLSGVSPSFRVVFGYRVLIMKSNSDLGIPGMPYGDDDVPFAPSGENNLPNVPRAPPRSIRSPSPPISPFSSS